MFDVYCPGHRSRVLLGHRSIDAVRNTDDGVELRWTCRCGTHGVLRGVLRGALRGDVRR